jgi:hypothetical protein
MKNLFLFIFLFTFFCSGAQESFITNQNKYTCNNIEYLEVKSDLQGKPFTSSFIPDGVLHVKRNGKIFRAQSESPNVYKASWFGIIPGNDCSGRFDSTLKLFPKNYPIELKLELGSYRFSKPIVIERQPVRLIGVFAGNWEGYTTEFHFTGSHDGIILKGCVNAHLENIHVRGSGKGRGVLISSKMSMRNVWVTHFEKGVEIYGDIYNGNGYDASRGVYHNLTIAVCKTGLRTVGGDANQNTFYDLDIRDIDSIGLMESSFLGNTYYSPHFNNCKGGAIRVTDLNSIVSFYDVYMEDGMPVSKVTGNTSFFGARTFATQIEGGMVQRGVSFGKISVREVTLTEGLMLQNNWGGNWGLFNRGNKWEFNYSNLNYTKLYLLQPGKEFRGKQINSPSIGQEFPDKVTPIIK